MRTSNPDFEDGTLNAYVINSSEVMADDRFGYKVVAVVNYSGKFWSAYRGPTSWLDGQVGANGDAVSESIAVLLFPSIAAVCTYYV